MGFIQRVQDETVAEAVRSMEQESDEQQRLAEIAEVRKRIIAERMTEFAESLGAQIQPLRSTPSHSQFLVDDIMIVVRPHGTVDSPKRLSTARSEVLWQHYASIAAVDITGRVVEIGRSTLVTLDYGFIRRTLSSNVNLEFDNARVLAAL